MGLQPFDAQKAQEIAIRAYQLAEAANHEYVTVEHLLAALLLDADVVKTFAALEINLAEIDAELTKFFQGPLVQIVPGGRKPRRTLAIQRVVDRAVTQVMFSGRRIIETTDILLAILPEEDCHAAYLLKAKDLDEAKLKSYLAHGLEGASEEAASGAPGTATAEDTNVDSDQKAEKLLRKYCVLLNERALEGKIDPLIGRHKEVEDLVLILARRTKNNAVLTGEPGVGKTAIAEGLALRIEKKEVPEILHGVQVWSLDIGALMAGTKFRGDMEERIKQVLKSIAKLSETKQAILFIDEIHMIMGAGSGSQGAMDVSNLLKPALSRGELRCIGSTTIEEYRKHFEKDRGLLRRFQKLDIFEPSIADAKLIIRGLADNYAKFHSVTYDLEALDAAVDLTARYMQDKVLPDKAIDVIDVAGARKRVMRVGEEIQIVNIADIEVEVSKIAKIPARSVKEDESDQLATLEPDLLANVFDQEPAIRTVVDTVLLSRAGLREPNKPQGSYLFTGSSGVGKTEVAKQLAKTLNIELIRFDMSEYMEKHAVSKLIGAPPGYVGFGDGQAGSGLLTNAVETHPHCVLLLDEIEKAHPDLFNILLQVMDDGRLTNGAGKTVDFKNLILIMTSNAGAREMSKNALGFGREKITGEDDKAVNTLFAPEFINRLDAVVKFNNIKPGTMSKIVDKFLAQLNVLSADKNVKVEVAPTAKEWLAKKGYEPKYGARPLARVMQKHIKIPLSREILFGKLKHGGTAVIVLDGDDLKIEVVTDILATLDTGSAPVLVE
jgi:ATP-dependent Clp protease ATP-binding subunit ClpA